MCLYRALNLYCSSLWNTRMEDIAEKCDQGGEQEPNISTDIYSAHIWWLVAGGRCGHTLKINTNNARSPIPYTPYSYTLYIVHIVWYYNQNCGESRVQYAPELS